MTDLVEPQPQLRLAGEAPLVPHAEQEGRESGSLAKLALVSFLENKLAIVGLGMLVLIALFCYLGPAIYHTNQFTVNPLYINESPSSAHILGTDNEGFDIMGRLMYAGRSSLEVGLAAGICSALFGTIYGALAAVLGGAVDAVMMRLVDALFSIPALFLLILISTIVPRSLWVMILILAFISWLGPARLVRGEALTLRTREYVEAVKVAGGGRRRIVLRHIVPNAIGTIMVNATFLVADSILALAALSYLGLGLPDTTPSWGAMLSNGTTFVFDGYWWEIYPAGIAIVLTVVAFTFVGDALRDSLDVRLIKR